MQGQRADRRPFCAGVDLVARLLPAEEPSAPVVHISQVAVLMFVPTWKAMPYVLKLHGRRVCTTDLCDHTVVKPPTTPPRLTPPEE